METLTYGEIPADLSIGEPYRIRCGNQSDLTVCADAINQGIDAHLEAVRTTSRSPGEFTIDDSKSMRVFLRRLIETDNDEAHMLASDVMTTLGYEWI